MPEESFDENKRRIPAKFTQVEGISSDDPRVSIIGTVVDKNEKTLIVDDGTGKIEVEFDLSENLSEFEAGDKVRIIGRPREEGLKEEAVQDFSDFDLELYKEGISKLREIQGQF